jgi:hypothetical protein
MIRKIGWWFYHRKWCGIGLTLIDPKQGLRAGFCRTLLEIVNRLYPEKIMCDQQQRWIFHREWTPEQGGEAAPQA